MNSRKIALAVVAVAALAIPAAAGAKTGHGHHNGQNKPHLVKYVFKGTYDGSGTVSVTHGNSHARKAGLVGQDVTFDLTNAKFRVADTNGDGTRNADDLATGDKVLVTARLPRKDPGTQPFAARKVIDKTHPPS